MLDCLLVGTRVLTGRNQNRVGFHAEMEAEAAGRKEIKLS